MKNGKRIQKMWGEYEKCDHTYIFLYHLHIFCTFINFKILKVLLISFIVISILYGNDLIMWCHRIGNKISNTIYVNPLNQIDMF